MQKKRINSVDDSAGEMVHRLENVKSLYSMVVYRTE